MVVAPPKKSVEQRRLIRAMPMPERRFGLGVLVVDGCEEASGFSACNPDVSFGVSVSGWIVACGVCLPYPFVGKEGFDVSSGEC